MKENQKSFNLFTWIKNYPTKFVIFILLIVIPVMIIVLATMSFSRKNNRFYFDSQGDNKTYLYQKDVNKRKDFNKFFETFELTVEEYKVINPNGKEPTEEYKFNLNKNLKPEYKNADVSYRHVLATKFYDRQSSVSTGVGTNTTNFLVRYPFYSKDNKNKLLILKSGFPSLYLEVTIRSTIPGVGEIKEDKLIYKVDINKNKIKNIIPN